MSTSSRAYPEHGSCSPCSTELPAGAEETPCSPRRKGRDVTAGCDAADRVVVLVGEPEVAVGADGNVLGPGDLAVRAGHDGDVAARRNATDGVFVITGEPEPSVRSGGDVFRRSDVVRSVEDRDLAAGSDAADEPVRWFVILVEVVAGEPDVAIGPRSDVLESLDLAVRVLEGRDLAAGRDATDRVVVRIGEPEVSVGSGDDVVGTTELDVRRQDCDVVARD